MAQKVVEVRETTETQVTKNFNERMQAALVKAESDANKRISNLEQDLRQKDGDYADKLRLLKENVSIEIAEAISDTEAELIQSREALAESKQIMNTTEAQHQNQLDAMALEISTLSDSLSTTKSELAAAAIPLRETQRLRQELSECKVRFSDFASHWRNTMPLTKALF